MPVMGHPLEGYLEAHPAPKRPEYIPLQSFCSYPLGHHRGTISIIVKDDPDRPTPTMLLKVEINGEEPIETVLVFHPSVGYFFAEAAEKVTTRVKAIQEHRAAHQAKMDAYHADRKAWDEAHTPKLQALMNEDERRYSQKDS